MTSEVVNAGSASSESSPAEKMSSPSTSHNSASGLKYWGYLQRYSEGFYGIMVPDVKDSAAAGETIAEALEETVIKTSCMLKDLPPEQIPVPSDKESACKKARAYVEEDGGEFIHEEYWEMIEVPVDFSLVKELPAEELERFRKKYIDID
ncbi:hypothetical protein Vretimale_947 [Volvox reticuliferus]|uniref:Uncharacterized protein n=1 Tax=Volvox reticuliferus TaxID=1737510 RepID=A0A8J4D4B1_9CHLO|nr:hypothetical protein Vretifemale_10574 [Volvox reticuliferus]GIL94803.1 hypothetical protein Vretimale_947 [Volvox reticuliferus]